MVVAERGRGEGRRRYAPDAPEAPDAEARETVEIALAALYLEGAPRGLEAPKGRWPQVRHVLRTEVPPLGEVERVLRRAGLREEALAVQDSRLLEWAERRVRAGVVLTAGSLRYPGRWERVLGGAAPAALWLRGQFPEGPYLAIVGSRRISAGVRRFAFECGAEAARLGYAVVSGGAGGCDRAAVQGAVSLSEGGQGVVEILPCGLNLRSERLPGAALSPFAPDAEFSAGRAMMRNALVYALGEAAVLCHARFGEGGTWHGAVSAHRRRLCPLWMRDDGSRAAQALIALGASPLERPLDLTLLADSSAGLFETDRLSA